MEDSSSWKIKIIVFGALIGAITGLLGAFLMIKRAEQTKSMPKLTTRDGVKVGAGLLSILKIITNLGEKQI